MKKQDYSENNLEDLKILRHSAAHLLAHALWELYPNIILTIGPATQDGFFYDILLPENIKEKDLEAIEKRMHEISKKNYSITHQEISKLQARELYKNNKFKLELIDNIPGDTVGLSIQGDFKDLCRGGHVKSTGDIKYFKLTGISGSYWRARKENQALERIHGTAFFTQEDLENYEKRIEEASKYDHRKLAKQLDLFSFNQEAIGFPFFHPKGKAVIKVLIEYMRKLHYENNYKEITTPTLLNDDLWHKSGHYAHYKENMYFTCVDETTYAIKPMNCPGSFLVYKHRPRSYRELPLKLAEFGYVHRHELSGVLHGLLRVRAFTQDDAHIYCAPDQIKTEVINILNIASKVLNKCEFTDIKFALSTKPEKALGNDYLWAQATHALEDALKDLNLQYSMKEGEGAFYGPKIEILIQDSMGREWQCGTVQLDFFQSENFNLKYVTSTGTFEHPVIIHQAIYGSLERFFAILLEHYKGNLPFWLAPVQLSILTITEQQKDYAKSIQHLIAKEYVRLEVDYSSDPINAKIKNAQLNKIPLMIIIGKKEQENNTASIRYLDGKQEFNISTENLIEKIKKLIKL